MYKKIIFLIFFFYFLVLFQNSFLIHFWVLRPLSNLVLIFVIFINFFEKPDGKLGLISAFLGGLFLDIFSIGGNFFFGLYTLIAVMISIFLKLFFKKYVRVPSKKGF